MNGNMDTQIRQLLEGYLQQPPAGCWNRLSARLDMLNLPSGGSSAGASEGASSVGQAAAGMTAKAVIGGIGAAVAIAGAMVWFYVKSEAGSPISEPAVENGVENRYSQDSQSADTLTSTVVVPVWNTDSSAAGTKTASSQSAADALKTTAAAEETAYADAIPTPSPSPVSAVEKTPAAAVEEPAKQPQETAPRPVIEVPSRQNAVRKTTEKSVPTPVETVSDRETNNETVSEMHEQSAQQPDLSIANFLSPNGDGINDVFAITGIEQVPVNQLIVFNRHGTVVFECNRYQNQWSGENVLGGVYYYIFKFTFHGNEFMRKGSITIVK
jgi:gliding motility-associated-like protein